MHRTRPLARNASDALVHDAGAGLDRLLEIMRRLRDPEAGCPWDQVQDFDSIAPYTIEEAHEVADAIRRRAMDELEGELGDLLLQVVYHAQMAAEAGAFGFDDVIRAISGKMLRRHPHVFGDKSRDKSPDQQTRDWEAIKAAERAAAPEPASVLDGVALALPGLTRAVKLQDRAARVGFDWPEAEAVVEKIAEETRELADARRGARPEAVEEEFGDLLFGLANLARHLRIDPEAALRAANSKFERRFRAIEAVLAASGRTPAQSDLAEMDALWNAAKSRERSGA
jgi:nucleoside triphosphate diphosphatase